VKALLVSNDPANREAVVRAVRRRGHTLHVVSTIDEALVAQNIDRAPLLIVDLRLGHRRIIELCRAMHGQREQHPIDMVVITDETAQGRLSELLDAGADDLLFEPLDETQVSHRILFSERRLTDARRRHTSSAPVSVLDPMSLIGLEARLRAVVDFAPIILFAFDRNGIMTLSEGRGLLALGLRPAEVVGRSAFDLYRDAPWILANIRRALAGEEFISNGEVHGVAYENRYVPVRDAGGAVVGVIGVATDVTERVRAEEALRTSEAAMHRAQSELQQVVEQLPDCVAIRQGDRIVYANPAANACFGIDLVGHNLVDLVHPDERERVARRMRRLDESGVSDPPIEVRFLRPDGEVITLEMGTAARRVRYEGMEAALLVGRDVSERKKMQSRLLLADRMASVGTLAAGVAHEINNPLAYLIGNLSLIARALSPLRSLAGRDHPSFSDIDSSLAGAHDGAERVRLIVRDLMTFSRADDVHRGPIDVRTVLDSSINVARNEIRHRARLRKDYGEVPVVYANESRLGQVFLNLLVNAAQAIPEGDAGQNEIRVVTSTEGGQVVIEVHDTGTGIPPATLRRIFDPFFSTKAAGGTGLGLAICHGIVTSLGGDISVESEVGRGSVFRVVLPVGRVDSTTKMQAVVVPTSTRRGRLLVVDDEPLIGETIARQLAPDHEVVTVSSAQDALERLTGGEEYDLVLCDLMMPEMTGMELHAELTRKSSRHAASLVFVTGGAFTARARAFLDAVPNERLEKPFEEGRLRALLAERLAKPTA